VLEAKSLLDGARRDAKQRGRVVFDHVLVAAAGKAYQECETKYEAGIAGIADIHIWSLRWANALASENHVQPGAIAAYEQHLVRMQRSCRKVRASKNPSRTGLSESDYYVLEAKKLLSDAKAKAGSN